MNHHELLTVKECNHAVNQIRFSQIPTGPKEEVKDVTTISRSKNSKLKAGEEMYFDSSF